MDPVDKGLSAVWEEVESYVQAEQLELDDLELLGRGRTRTLRVLVDGPSLDLDRIAEVSRGLSRLLDGLDVALLAGPYQLEISSPGLERKLTRPRQFQKSKGREVVVRSSAGHQRGMLESADDAGFTLATDEGRTIRYLYPEVESARTVFKWERPPKPGQRRTS